MQSIMLHPPGPEDAAALLAFELANRAYFEHWINARADDYYRLDAVHHAIEDAMRARQQDQSYAYLIKAGDEIVGRINLVEVRRAYFNKASLGYRIGESSVGRGFASQAVRLVLREAFDHLKLWRVEASIRSDNIGSIRAAERNGFTAFGTIRDAFYLHTKWHDLLQLECRSPHGPLLA